jgi:hypothetical protein
MPIRQPAQKSVHQRRFTEIGEALSGLSGSSFSHWIHVTNAFSLTWPLMLDYA